MGILLVEILVGYMSKNDFVFVALIMFTALFWGDVVSKLNIPPQYESYVLVGGGLIIFTVIINTYQNRGRG